MKALLVMVVLTLSLGSGSAFCEDNTNSADEWTGSKIEREVGAPGRAPHVPGEEIQTDGKKIRVWTTTGPVSVGPVPTPPVIPSSDGQALPVPLGVIVDKGDRSRRNAR